MNRDPLPAAGSPRPDRVRAAVLQACAIALPVFCLAEVNWPVLKPQSELAIFAALGAVMIFLGGAGPTPAGVTATGRRGLRLVAERWLGIAAAVLFAAVCLYVVIQTEPLFARWWSGGQSLGDRAGAETALDLAAGGLGLVLVLWAARRSLGWSLPILALGFLAYARWGSVLPDWLLPHRGYGWERIVGQTFLHSQGVFGVALNVMFTYVFPFLVFGALLEACGATGYILDASNRLLGKSRGGPAKVAVVASGLMGSLNGSAVANTATTGTFTIPMMRAAGFRPETAAGLEAAASSGGALVPPVMGAGAYMMLEIIDPPVTYLQIVRAAILPSLLYYLALYLIVHFRAHRLADLGLLPSTRRAPLPPKSRVGEKSRSAGQVIVSRDTPDTGSHGQGGVGRDAPAPATGSDGQGGVGRDAPAPAAGTDRQGGVGRDAPAPAAGTDRQGGEGRDAPAPAAGTDRQGGVGRDAPSQGRQPRRPTNRFARLLRARAGDDEGRAHRPPLTQSAPRPLGGGVSTHPGPQSTATAPPPPKGTLLRWEGLVFLAALATLITLLLLRYSVPRAVTWSMAAALVLALANRRTRPTPRTALRALTAASQGGVALIAASAAVGIVLGVVTLTGVGSALPALLLPLAENNLLLALLALMASSIVLGMGLPSAVCYLLLATLVGPVLGQLGVVPLAAHMFIFYFGMMSMVTPPVALAAYAASSIAGSGIWGSSLAAFRFALIGFVLPFLFVYRPELLMLAPDGGVPSTIAVIAAAAVVALGTVPLAAAAAGWLGRPLGNGARALLFAAAALALVPAGPVLGDAPVTALNVAGLVLAGAVWLGGRWGRSGGGAARQGATPDG